MIKIKEAVIVEGKYDKIKLKGIIDAPIIETNGFRIFKDRDKRRLISAMAKNRGIIILTDSDSAGFVIRNHIKGIVPDGRILNAYIPQILGKESRKAQPSKEGLLGVEGTSSGYILSALRKCGATIENENSTVPNTKFTKSQLYELGLTGGEHSKEKRAKLLKRLGLPAYLTTNALLEILPCITTAEEFEEIVNSL